MKKKNVKRRKSEFIRCYLSKERVAFIRSLPCAACGVVGFSQNAHVAGESGVGYKADAEFIAPLCGPRASVRRWVNGVLDYAPFIGCHKQFDDYRWIFNAEHPDFDAAKAAAETQNAWVAFQGEKT